MVESVLLKLHLILTTPATGVDTEEIQALSLQKTEAERSKVIV